MSICLLEFRDATEDLIEESPADHRGFLEDSFGLHLQPVQSGGDDPLHRRGDVGFAEGLGEQPLVVLLNECCRFQERVDHFLQVEGIALYLGLDELLELRRDILGFQQGLHHILGFAG